MRGVRTLSGACHGLLRRGYSTHVRYPGAETAEYTSELRLWQSNQRGVEPCFRVIDEQGKLTNDAEQHVLDLKKEHAIGVYKSILNLYEMDSVLLDAQRQGRISFYLTARGEEAAIIGSTAALHPHDTVFTQYREGAGVLLHRGWGYEQICNQCMGNVLGHGRGRQMPIHHGSKKLYVQTVSSPLATQIPHAVGAAHALRGSNNTAAVFFGEGAASEGDFAGALQFAATLDVPVIFLCRNNGYAISTPASQQYRSDGVAGRAVGAGVAALRVDGNDVWAVMSAVKHARNYAMDKVAPVLVELMTYRTSHHSTSDDSSRYRSEQEMKWFEKMACPVERTGKYLIQKGWWDMDKDNKFRSEQRELVLSALEKAEKVEMPLPDDLFGQVYSEEVPSIRAQREQLRRHHAADEQQDAKAAPVTGRSI